ncbi:nitroreductase/quinone reductase family protein [Mycetocola zhujimingii]|uniref:Nitroreductase family deazaflavin-dependent oxidoreductase n=1 Tax=Mycetocola zhujimingii TaxID=2079792 RepID=A0A2U1TGZ5_9MICO|nr:nitroreductase/quinone reductase family protein [Mycetocola zhujimingii]PWC08162.1 nitroreductase family deazaflavin-dependent oxidoreductase [Mycetocola zhujimingii]
MSLKATITDVGMRAINTLHRGVLAATGGRLGSRLGTMDVVELHTIGRTSGRRRTTMLTTPISDAEKLVLVASKGGSDSHPAWYLNLRSNPEVEVTVSGETRKMRARTASPEEKDELWPRIVGAYPGYARYQRKTGRDIPVVICEPRDAD